MKPIKKQGYKLMVIAICILATFNTIAQGNPGKDPMLEYFFPPELVMQHQNEIQLKKEQKELIIGVMEESQKKFTRLQWDLQTEMTALQKLFAEPIANETKVLEQLDKVLDQERTIKKAQVTLMLRIKNTLTEDQKTKLNTMKGM